MGRPRSRGPVTRISRREEALVRRILWARQWIAQVMEHRREEIESSALSIGIDYGRISVQGGVVTHKAQSVVERLESDPIYTSARRLVDLYQATWPHLSARDQQILKIAVLDGEWGPAQLAERIGLSSKMGGYYARSRALAAFWGWCLEQCLPCDMDGPGANLQALATWLSRWVGQHLDTLEDYVRRMAGVQDDRVFTVGGDTVGTRSTGRKCPPLYVTRGSLAVHDVTIWLNSEDEGRVLKVRIPWGVSYVGGAVFRARVLVVLDDRVVFQAMDHVGDLGHGCKVYTTPNLVFGINRQQVRGPAPIVPIQQ